jgi:Thioesterase-like superfamily
MGRTEGSLASKVVPAGGVPLSRARGRLSVVGGGPGRAVGTAADTVAGLLGALDLVAVGDGEFEVQLAERGRASLSGARLVASAVVAAERSFPGYEVRHLSCAVLRSPGVGRSSRIVMTWTHIGVSCAIGRITFVQDGVPHCHVAVTLHPSETARTSQPVSHGGGVLGGGHPGGPGRLAAVDEADLALGLTPWVLRRIPGSEHGVGDEQVDGGRSSLTAWTQIAGLSTSPTMQRALLAFLSEQLAAVSLRSVRPGAPQVRTEVLSHGLAFIGGFDLADGLVVTVASVAVEAGSGHGTASFRTLDGAPVATVSQGLAVGQIPVVAAARGGRGLPRTLTRRRHLALTS